MEEKVAIMEEKVAFRKIIDKTRFMEGYGKSFSFDYLIAFEDCTDCARDEIHTELVCVNKQGAVGLSFVCMSPDELMSITTAVPADSEEERFCKKAVEEEFQDKYFAIVHEFNPTPDDNPLGVFRKDACRMRYAQVTQLAQDFLKDVKKEAEDYGIAVNGENLNKVLIISMSYHGHTAEVYMDLINAEVSTYVDGNAEEVNNFAGLTDHCLFSIGDDGICSEWDYENVFMDIYNHLYGTPIWLSEAMNIIDVKAGLTEPSDKFPFDILKDHATEVVIKNGLNGEGTWADIQNN